MRHDDLNRILSAQEEIIPSSGFVSSVMDAVRHDAGAPRPIPFPWRRALPGLCAVGLTFAWVVVAGSTLFMRATATEPLPARLLSALTLILETWKIVGASWLALALVLTFASLKLATSFARRKT